MPVEKTQDNVRSGGVFEVTPEDIEAGKQGTLVEGPTVEGEGQTPKTTEGEDN